MSNVTQTVVAKITQAKNHKITNFVVGTAGVEQSHALQTNCKQLLVRSREVGMDIKFCFTLGQSGTNYVTISRNASLSLKDMELGSDTLYFQTNITGTVEILELY